MARFGLMIPTLNAEKEVADLLSSLKMQTRQPDRVLVIDSSSTDRTTDLLAQAGAEVHVIDRSTFNHGGTRMAGARMLAENCDIVVFMTQDAILDRADSLERILAVFEDETVASAYGRQLPHIGAKAIENFSRLFNYSDTSTRRTRADIPRIGFHAAFCSNSFSAFRISALEEVGGFPVDTILGEDALAAGDLILAGSTHCYVAEATVRHSHSYNLVQEFQRYFDIGVMHAQTPGLIENFGSPLGAGRAYVIGEQKYLLRNAPLRIPEAMLRTLLKYGAYKMGRREDRLSLVWKRRLSMHKFHWRSQDT